MTKNIFLRFFSLRFRTLFNFFWLFEGTLYYPGLESCTSRNVLLELDPSSCVLCSCSTRARGKVSIWCSCSTRARDILARARPVLEGQRLVLVSCSNISQKNACLKSNIFLISYTIMKVQLRPFKTLLLSPAAGDKCCVLNGRSCTSIVI